MMPGLETKPKCLLHVFVGVYVNLCTVIEVIVNFRIL
jgi:hypothetical protein